MSGILEIRDRQRFRRVRVEALRALAEWMLGADPTVRGWELGIHLVSARAMARLHVRWLGVPGSTDIITFDHGSGRGRLHGELFISVEDAVRQSEDFGTSPGSELARYVVHGILHLQGYDDLEPSARRTMKARENAWVRRAARGRNLAGLVASRPRGVRSRSRHG